MCDVRAIAHRNKNTNELYRRIYATCPLAKLKFSQIFRLIILSDILPTNRTVLSPLLTTVHLTKISAVKKILEISSTLLKIDQIRYNSQ